jgi:hypothetical protein
MSFPIMCSRRRTIACKQMVYNPYVEAAAHQKVEPHIAIHYLQQVFVLRKLDCMVALLHLQPANWVLQFEYLTDFLGLVDLHLLPLLSTNRSFLVKNMIIHR